LVQGSASETRRLLDSYLEARYTCTALWAKARRICPDAAKALREGLEQLCKETRDVMRQLGLETVGEKFSPALLEKPLETLLEQCLAKTNTLLARGSRAAKRLADAANKAKPCIKDYGHPGEPRPQIAQI